MSIRTSGRPAFLGYCLLAVILFGCFVLLNRGGDNSGTLAPPNAVVIR
jgi:hypothetical protein